MKELESVLWELESAGGKATNLDVSLEFWKKLQCSNHVRLAANGDIFYKYLQVNIDPKLEENYQLY